MPKRKPLARLRKNWELLLLALPGIGFFIVFNYIPMYGVALPFFRYDARRGGLISGDFVGLRNFEFLFIGGDAWRITRNTIMFNLIFIVLGLIVAVIFALMLYELSSRFVKLYQTILFIPFFLSWVVVSYIGLSVLDMQHGFLNVALQSFGGQPRAWYNVPQYWYVILPLANLWKGVGFGTLIYYTSLININPELYEVSNIDGATKMQQIRYISLPMIKPIMVMLTLLALGGMIRADFGLFFQFTRDSSMLYPVTDVIDTYVFRALRQLGNIGMAAAAGFYQSVVGLITILLANWAVRRFDKDSALF